MKTLLLKNLHVLTFGLLISLGAFAEPSASHGLSSSPQKRPQDAFIPPSLSGESKVRFFKDKVQYQTSQGEWLFARASFKTDEPGTLLNAEGKTVEYKTGDLLFKTVNGELSSPTKKESNTVFHLLKSLKIFKALLDKNLPIWPGYETWTMEWPQRPEGAKTLLGISEQLKKSFAVG